MADHGKEKKKSAVKDGSISGLTPAEAERLAILMEGCAEVQQVIGKILRHGYGSYHPDRPGDNNRNLLEKELGDVIYILGLMALVEDVDLDAIKIYASAKMK